ncbi:hypothetical protein BH24BAC1_BH24BAC1_33240 [soil metagenome]
MRIIKRSTVLGWVLLLLFTLSSESGFAQHQPQGETAETNAPLALKDGDRVVFVGNSLFENDLPYGYLELALTTRWPHVHATYRNIGWTGDTVWGEARGYISPPSHYALLVEQLTEAQPTVVFIAYGAIEALEGEAGLPRFSQGLNQLLDQIDQLGAKAILLSPLPSLAAASAEDAAMRNTMLERYAAAITKTASERGKQYIDIFTPFQVRNDKQHLSDNGLHLNETGYHFLASTIEKGLGLAPRQESFTINLAKNAAEATAPAKILDTGKNKAILTFTLNEGYLPLPLPEQAEGTAAASGQVLKIAGLKKGLYTLTAYDSQVITASAKEWKEGVAIRQGALYSQAEQLREKINKKNELFFHQYRPLNKTYISGFRSYEQGRHAKGLEDLSIIITWIEGRIALNRLPKPVVYHLTPVK